MLINGIDQPMISVLLPVFNAENYIELALNSLLNQTYQNFEVLLIDDSSTDSTSNIIKSFKDERIKYYRNSSNEGVSSSLNRAISMSQGEYLARMDADDISAPERFENQINIFRNDLDLGVCGSWINLIGHATGTRAYPENDFEIKIALAFGCPVAHPSVMLRKAKLQKLKSPFYRDIKWAEDYDLWVRLSEVTKFYNVPKPLLEYRIHPDQVNQVHSQEKEKSAAEIMRNYLSHLGLNVSHEEIELHMKITSGSKVTKEELEQANEWVKKLFSLENKFGKGREFKKAIQHVLWHFCNANTHHFLGSMKIYNEFCQLKNEFDSFEKFKFYIKLLLRH